MFFPVQMVRDNPAPLGNTSFLKRLSLRHLDSEEASEAAATINAGLGTRPTPVDFAIDVVLTNNEGGTHHLLLMQTTEDKLANKGL